ncbi:protein SpAN-like [Hydractinia symbiolongicarpus]|uniref:protein SpAN-like n=1 Tax=Hydractinia symbiolongicarpus TaxID=13093 RepID=UPI00254A949B|nr:protein SpAN-like [Hydractinia symbiolongicarpus]
MTKNSETTDLYSRNNKIKAKKQQTEKRKNGVEKNQDLIIITVSYLPRHSTHLLSISTAIIRTHNGHILYNLRSASSRLLLNKLDSSTYGSLEYEAAMDEIGIANQGKHYDQVDMKLTEEQRATFKSLNSKSRNKRSLYDKLYDVRWPEAVVPITFSSDFGEAEKATIKKAMRTIESVSCVRFKEYTPGFAPFHHVYINKGTGCWSYIGRTHLGKQELSLGFGCVQADLAIHELLHALGFFHEQSRQDRDQYVTIKHENIRPGYEDEFKISEYSSKDGLGVKYDPESIMHYGRFTFSKNRWSLPTIEWKSNPNRKLGGKKMTASDILQLNLYYECKGYEKTTRPTAITTTTTRPTTTTTTTTRPTTTTTTTTRPTTTTTTTTRPTTTTTTTTRPTTTTTTKTRPTTTTTTTTRPTTTRTTTTRPTTTTTTTTRPTTTTTTKTRPTTTTTTTTRPTTTRTTKTRPTTATTTKTRPTTTTTTTTGSTSRTTTTRPTTTTTTKFKTKTAQPTTTIKTTPKAMTTIRPTTKSSKVCGDEVYLCSKVFVNRAICAFGRFCRRSCGLCSGPRENMCDLLVNAINVGCNSSRRKEHCVSKDKKERRRMKQECPKTCCMRGQFYE